MNPIIKTIKRCRAGAMWLAVFLTLPLQAAVPSQSAEAYLVAKVGEVKALVLTGPIHEGNVEMVDLAEGDAVGEGAKVVTGKDGRVSLLLSMGAVVCVAPSTEFTLTTFRKMSDGLPQSEDDLIRRVHLDLTRGRILVRAAAPLATLDIRVQTPEGRVESSGGTFVVAQTDPDGKWVVVSEEYDLAVTPLNGAKTAVAEGQSIQLVRSGDQVSLEAADAGLNPALLKFEVCSCYFDDLDTYLENPNGVTRTDLAQWIGTGQNFAYQGGLSSYTDVSPSVPWTRPGGVQPQPFSSPHSSRGRWDSADAWMWYEQVGVLKGVNYIPRNCVNSTEMWQQETFDPGLIDEELGWAQRAGYTALRVQLQYVVWDEDPEGFLKRFEQFLKLAEKHDLRVVPVLFDDHNVAGTDPTTGPQPEPIPGKNNARWTPSPGVERVLDRTAWPRLEEYVKGVIEAHKTDDRVVYWDLYNRAGDHDLWEKVLPLMDQTFTWAREAGPEQPLSIAAWTKMGSAMSARMIEKSDIITFQSYEGAPPVSNLLKVLERYNRPVICSDWMMRQNQSTFEALLPLFSIHRVGWFNRGLVRGQTQEWVQQDDQVDTDNPELWQHDVLKQNGEAYRENELKLIQSFRFDR